MPEQSASSRNVPAALDVILLCLAVFLLIQTAGPFLAAALGSPWGSVAAQIVLIFGPALFFLLVGRFDLKRSLPSAPPTWRGVVSGVLLGVSLWLPAGLALILASTLLGEDSVVAVDDILRRTLEEAERRIGPVGVLALFAALPGFAEEFLFRGVVLPAFLRKFSFVSAILGAAILFGVFHLNAPQAFPTTTIGIFLGYAVARSGSLWISMIAHAVHNAVILLVAILLPSPEGEEFNTIPLGYLGSVLLLAIACLWVGIALLPRRPFPPEKPPAPL